PDPPIRVRPLPPGRPSRRPHPWVHRRQRDGPSDRPRRPPQRPDQRPADPERGVTMRRDVDWTRGPERPRPMPTVLLALSGLVYFALASSFADRQLSLSDRARLWIAAAVFGLGIVIVVAVLAIRPLLPSLVMKPGRLTPFAILAGAVSIGLVGVWALAAGRKRASGGYEDFLTGCLPLATFLWLVGLTGFLLWPFRYGVTWYVAGLARPVGLGVILVGLMREQIWLYREIVRKNDDLTARELTARAEAAAFERRFADLVQDLDAIVWEADATWRFSFVSDRAEAILGYPVTQWLTEPELMLEHHIHPEDRERTLTMFREAAAQDRNSDFEYRAIAANARPVWLRAMVHIVRDEHGRAEKLRGLMVDVS